jgi:hypothetical protein
MINNLIVNQTNIINQKISIKLSQSLINNQQKS